MNIQLLRGVPPSEADKVKGPISTLLADPHFEYIRRAVRLQHKKGKPADYDNPAWGYKQAHDNGYNQAIEDVITLLQSKG